MADDAKLDALVAFLHRVPGIDGSIGKGWGDDGTWWIKFTLDTEHPLAWEVVQNLGHVLNSISIDERLPTAFMPVSPPPYLNGGARDYLSWVIECRDAEFGPDLCRQWLETRLPDPVDDPAAWADDDEDDESEDDETPES
ncbi:MAG TPA: hypothetical protein VIW69_09015 [Candidatus Elarobacter sp.]